MIHTQTSGTRTLAVAAVLRYQHAMMKRLQSCLLALSVVCAGAASVAGEELPRLFDTANRLTKPDLTGLPRLRFLTTLDFPPFNFADANKKATGFNVDVARAICAQLQLEAKCEIQAMPWEELEAALEGRRGEAVIAGHAPDGALRLRYNLSEPYFRFPARFAALSATDVSGDFPDALNGRKVGVVRGSAHEAMLARHFPQADAVALIDEPAAYSALRSSDVDFLFADAVTLSFFVASAAADGCCALVGGDYYSNRFLGNGMSIMTRKADARLNDAMNAALHDLEKSGALDEIFARYFPVSPFAGTD